MKYQHTPAMQEPCEFARAVRIAIQEEVRTEPRSVAFSKGMRAAERNQSRYVNPYRHGSFKLQCEWAAGYDAACAAIAKATA